MNDYFLVGASYGLIWLGDPDWTGDALSESDTDDLLTNAGRGLYIHTGTHTGLVEIQANSWRDANSVPTGDVDASIDVEVATACLQDSSGDACVLPLGGEGEVIAGITSEPGTYVVRCTAFGRHFDLLQPDRPRERYVIDVWPAGVASGKQ